MEKNDPMLTPFEVFHAPWRDYGSGQWGFWHVDHWAYAHTESAARDLAAYCKAKHNGTL